MVFLNKHVFVLHKKFKFLVSQASIAETGVVLPAFLMSPVENMQELPTVAHTAFEQRFSFHCHSHPCLVFQCPLLNLFSEWKCSDSVDTQLCRTPYCNWLIDSQLCVVDGTGLNFKSVEKMIAENADHFLWPLMMSMERLDHMNLFILERFAATDKDDTMWLPSSRSIISACKVPHK